jgi:hypothetical protein
VRKMIKTKIETQTKSKFLKNFGGDLLGLVAVNILLATLFISIALYIQFDPSFSIFTHYVSGLGGVPKGNLPGATYISATIYNLGMLMAVPFRVGFVISLVFLVKKMGSNKILTILSFGTSMLASAGWIILGLVPFSSNLQLHLIGALIYFLGATSFQLIFAITEFKIKKIPRKLPLLGFLNLLSFSIFSYFLIQVEVMQTPGIAEQPILEWIVYVVAIGWVLAHVKYMHNKRIVKNHEMSKSNSLC